MGEDTDLEWKCHLFLFSRVIRLLAWAFLSISQSFCPRLAQAGSLSAVLLGTAPGLHKVAPGTVASQTVVT